MNSLQETRTYLPTQYTGFLANYARNSQIATHSVISHFSNFISEHGVSLQTLTQDHINIYLNRMRNSGITPNSYNQRVSLLASFLKRFSKPFLLKRLKTKKYNTMAMINEDTLKSILSYIKDRINNSGVKSTKYLRDYVLFQFSFITGLRKSEVLNARHSQFKMNGNNCQYRLMAKGSIEIVKIIPNYLMKLIHQLKIAEDKDQESYVFTSKKGSDDKPLTARSYNYLMEAYIRYIDGKQVPTIHSIRNLSALKVYQSTGCILETKAHLNHYSLNTTQIYLEKLTKKEPKYHDVLVDMVRG